MTGIFFIKRKFKDHKFNSHAGGVRYCLCWRVVPVKLDNKFFFRYFVFCPKNNYNQKELFTTLIYFNIMIKFIFLDFWTWHQPALALSKITCLMASTKWSRFGSTKTESDFCQNQFSAASNISRNSTLTRTGKNIYFYSENNYYGAWKYRVPLKYSWPQNFSSDVSL